MTERIVLAYSGGLDTSVAIGWIHEATGAEVVAMAVDVGQDGEDLETIRQRALDCGAVEAYVADARDEFAEEYCMAGLKANTLYMDAYPNVSALSRPIIAKHLVRAARQFGATTVAHGCTGKGNDQVRFEVLPDLARPGPQVHRPGPRPRADARQAAIEYAERNELPIETTKTNPFSVDQNVWGRAVETGFLEDIWNEPHQGRLRATPTTRPSRRWPMRSSISFEKRHPGRDRRPRRHPARGDLAAEPARRSPGHRPHRHRRGPPGGHQVP